MNVTESLLRSFMAYRAPMPAGARLILAATELPAQLRVRLTSGDLKGFSWRAWASGRRVIFMAAVRVFDQRPAGKHEMLQVIAHGPDGESTGHWQHRRAGVWELVAQGGHAQS